METYRSLENFILRNSIAPETKLLIAYRESLLKIAIIGNSFTALEDFENSGKDIQYKVETAGDYMNLINLAKEDDSNGVTSFRNLAISRLSNKINMTVKIDRMSMTGFGVSTFVQDDGKLILDITRESNEPGFTYHKL